MKRISKLTLKGLARMRSERGAKSTGPTSRHRGLAVLARLGGREREPRAAQRSARLLLVAILLLPQAVTPATIMVTGTDNSEVSGDGVCTLREAINNANTDTDTTDSDCAPGSGADTAELTADVTLAVPATASGFTGLPTITSEVTIEGNDFTIARGAGAAGDFRLAFVDPDAALTLNDTTVSGFSRAGALLNFGGTLTLTNSTLSGNTNIALVVAYGTTTLTDSTVSDNSGMVGAGIYSYYNDLTLINSTLSGNIANLGGGLATFGGAVTLTNSTVSGNFADFGGGFYVSPFYGGSVTVTNSTVSNNYAAGVGGSYFGAGTGFMTISNSIVVGGDCLGGPIDDGDNFTDSAGCPGAPITDGVEIDSVLADNGGPTETHALLPGSPAVNAAGDCGLATDQRGVPRDDGSCDSGSYELAAACEDDSVPVAWWAFDEGAGDDAFDSTPNGNDGELSAFKNKPGGKPLWTSDGGGHTGGAGDFALLFDGSDGYVDAGSDSTLDNLNSFTYTAWVKRGANGDLEIFSKQNSYHEMRFKSLGTLRGCVVGNLANACSDSNELVPLDTWTHVAMTYDHAGDKKVHLYINGSEVTYAAQSTARGQLKTDARADQNLGRRNNNTRHYEGALDEMMIFDSALPACRIQELAALPGPVGTSYTLPGSGGTEGGSYIVLLTASGRASLNLTCNFGFVGGTEAFWFAEDPSVSPGDIEITNMIDGFATQVFNDLGWNLGGQDRAFPETFGHGPRPWHGVFTAADGGVVTEWEVFFSGPTVGDGDCTAVVSGSGATGNVIVQHP